MAEVIAVEEAVWEYSVGQCYADVTTVALDSDIDKPIFYLEGDRRPPKGHHFEIHLVCVPDKEEEG